MEIIKLSNRMAAIAALVPQGANTADIGTDHGYIPVWLAQTGRAGKLAAADINRGPLEHARFTATQYGVSDCINFHLCSGLEFPEAPEYDTVIIAGMGGELIASILRAAPWTKEGVRLILQPNSKIQILNSWLKDNGYGVTDARLVKDAGKLYQILVASGGPSREFSCEAQRLVHPLFMDKRDPLLGEYLELLIARYSAQVRGMRSGAKDSPQLAETELLMQQLTAMREEVSQWQL